MTKLVITPVTIVRNIGLAIYMDDVSTTRVPTSPCQRSHEARAWCGELYERHSHHTTARHHDRALPPTPTSQSIPPIHTARVPFHAIMASRILRPVFRTVTNAPASARSFQTSAALREQVVATAPVRKPVGAFRGGSVLPSHKDLCSAHLVPRLAARDNCNTCSSRNSLQERYVPGCR
jgi:hypothetical protein